MDYCWWLYAGRTRSKCGGTGLLITGGRRARARAARCVLVVPQPQPRVTHRTLDTGYRCVLNRGHSPDLSHECYPEVLIGLRIQEIH